MTWLQKVVLFYFFININTLVYANSPVLRGACDLHTSNNDGAPWQIHLKDETPSEGEKLTFTYTAASARTNATFHLSTPVALLSNYQFKLRNGQTVTNLDEHIGVYMELSDGTVEEITATSKPFPPPAASTLHITGKTFYKFKKDPSIYANGSIQVTSRWTITCQ